MRNIPPVLVFASVIMLVIGMVAFSSSSASLSGGVTVTATEGQKSNVPRDCVRSSTSSAGGLSLRLDYGLNPTVHSFFCMHALLTNTGTQTISIDDDAILYNITDSSGRTVFFTASLAMPPLNSNANLAPGQVWESTGYWNTDLGYRGSGPATPGNYHLRVSLVPSGTTTALVTASEEISVLPAS